MSEAVAERVRAAISDHGPIGFDEYMELALYGPGGFFESPPVGPRGHFVTSPHVHPFVFSHCVRDALLEGWHALGEPDPLRIVELGAGDGTLARALLDAFAELPAPRPDYVAVEISPGARSALLEAGIAYVEGPDELAPFEGLVLANELLDNLPSVWARRTPTGVVEVRVGTRGNALCEVEIPWSRIDVSAPALASGEQTTVPLGAFAILDALAERLRRGYVLLIDYGMRAGAAGPPRGYHEQRERPDVLSDPGGSDITAGLDLALIASYARERGLRPCEPVRQRPALAALGHTRWERTMREMQSMLQEAGRGSEAVGVWEARSRASLLADPSGLGRLWWLVLSTPDLPKPTWVERASEPSVG